MFMITAVASGSQTLHAGQALTKEFNQRRSERATAQGPNPKKATVDGQYSEKDEKPGARRSIELRIENSTYQGHQPLSQIVDSHPESEAENDAKDTSNRAATLLTDLCGCEDGRHDENQQPE
jgi:hypothetical protein